jgi:putative membrane-bound dehydrogenase-like protein
MTRLTGLIGLCIVTSVDPVPATAQAAPATAQAAPATAQAAPATPQAEPPAPTDQRLTLELVAREPDIVTPTGIAVDERGRIWVIENNSHFRPPNYAGAPTDRIRVFGDFGRDGRARHIETFAAGFTNGMGLALAADGTVYLARRSEVVLLRDRDHDGTADERQTVVRLDTAGDYPHNGLSGFAFDERGDLYFGLGENLGVPYRLIGRDGTTLSGGGEGGNIYRCHPDGSRLELVATGFWNPFHMTFDAFGRLFAVDNDPDSRPPCRLLHIVPGGDYGYRFRNGRKGLHPFTAWNGELPGTLPMTAGTGEAPSGVVAYESDSLPDDYRGTLLVTSWGDHQIQRFRLQPRGASFVSVPEAIVRGGEDFRPVGIAIAPDGSVVFSDWVDKSYPLHGRGAIWRLRGRSAPRADGLRAADVAGMPLDRVGPLLGHPRREIRHAASLALANHGAAAAPAIEQALVHDDPRVAIHGLWAAARLDPSSARRALDGALADARAEIRAEAVRCMAARGEPGQDNRLLALATRDPSLLVRAQAVRAIGSRESLDALVSLLSHTDPFLVAAAIDTLSRLADADWLLSHLEEPDARRRLGVVLALRRAGGEAARAAIRTLLEDPDPEVRRAAVQWAGEDRRADLREAIAASAARPPVTPALFEACLAAAELLRGGSFDPKNERAGEDLVLTTCLDARAAPALRAIALRMLPPQHPAVTIALLHAMLGSSDVTLRHEAIRTLAARPDDSAQQLLRTMAADGAQPTTVRGDSVLGLAHSAGTPATRQLLLRLAAADDAVLRREALRSLRGQASHPEVATALRQLSRHADPDRDLELAEQLWLTAAPDRMRVLSEPFLGRAVQAGFGRPDAERNLKVPQGDSAAGARLFFHLRGPLCFNCHRVNGRGGLAGPDLSFVGRTLHPCKLQDSILDPSKEIAPQYTTWQIATRQGQTLTGIILSEDATRVVTLGDPNGLLHRVPAADIEQQQAQKTSIMPQNLREHMSWQELWDLIAFLSELQ